MADEQVRLNCWQYKKCGRENTCPAHIRDMGRMCWMVAGTMCGGTVQGTFAQKSGNCLLCDFYQHVTGQKPVTQKPLMPSPRR